MFHIGHHLTSVSQEPDCLLCPRAWRDPKKKTIYPSPDSYLRACKPTEGQAWVHAICSVFIPEVIYTDAIRLRLVEGISTIPEYRWTNVSRLLSYYFRALSNLQRQRCVLCERDGGAVVRCSECPAEFHVSCAWKQGHRFGFELQPVSC